MTAINRGFEFDEGDPSVGIFGGAWYHDDCSFLDVGVDPSEVIEEQIACVRRDSMTVRTWSVLTCIDCAQQTLVYDDQPDPSDEVLNEMERAEYEAERAEQARCDRADAEAEAMADAMLAAYDDDPNPYHGTYSEM